MAGTPGVGFLFDHVGIVEAVESGQVVTIEGNTHRDVDPGHSNDGYGVFRRSLALPSSHVEADKTKASVRDGVLEILVPKAAGAQATLIRVRVNQGNAVPAPRRDGEER